MITAQVGCLSMQFIHMFKPLLKNEFPFYFFWCSKWYNLRIQPFVPIRKPPFTKSYAFTANLFSFSPNGSFFLSFTDKWEFYLWECMNTYCCCSLEITQNVIIQILKWFFNILKYLIYIYIYMCIIFNIYICITLFPLHKYSNVADIQFIFCK